MCAKLSLRLRGRGPVCLVALVAVTSFLEADVAGAQGWGFTAKTTTITRLLPPTVNLRGKAVRVEASLAGNFADGQAMDTMLKTRLVTQIQKDPRFIVSESSPQTILRFSITNFYLEHYTVNSTNMLSANKGPSTKYRGKIEVAYQAVAADSSRPLDSENLKEVAGYDTETGSGSLTDILHPSKHRQAAENSANECKDQLVQGITEQMAGRIAASGRPVPVRLPGGKLDQVSALAIAGRWGDVQEKAAAMDKFPKPQDDAYRVYMVALAKEAQAYQLTSEANDAYDGRRPDITPAVAAKDMLSAQKLMDDSGTFYKEALQGIPKDREFLAGDTRAEEAIAIYATIARYKDENERASRSHVEVAAGPAAGSRDAIAGAPVPPPLQAAKKTPLDAILDMCHHDIDADSVRDYIQSQEFLDLANHSGYKFSFTEDTVRLRDACKANAPIYQRLIRTRLAPPAHPSGAR